MELSQIASFVDARPIQLLRRAQLWRIADQHGIPYPRDATKEMMVSVLENAGVDVTKPDSGVQWQMVRGLNEFGHNHQYLAPVIPLHQSAKENIDTTAKLQEIIAKPAKKSAEHDEIARRDALIEKQSAMLEKLSAKLDALEADQSPSQSYWARFREAKALGLPVERGMRREDIEALLHENTAAGSQRAAQKDGAA